LIAGNLPLAFCVSCDKIAVGIVGVSNQANDIEALGIRHQFKAGQQALAANFRAPEFLVDRQPLPVDISGTRLERAFVWGTD
jgi:hypothetical protein